MRKRIKRANSRPTTISSAGDRRCTKAEQSAALPASDVLPRLDRAVPALADRRRSAAAGADIKKVARVAAERGSIWQQLAASSGVSLRCAGPLAPFFRVASWRRVCVELVGALSRDLRGEDAFLEDAAPGAIVGSSRLWHPTATIQYRRRARSSSRRRHSDRRTGACRSGCAIISMRGRQSTGSWRRGRRGGGARFVMLI